MVSKQEQRNLAGTTSVNTNESSVQTNKTSVDKCINEANVDTREDTNETSMDIIE